jgi:type I restriction enzyme, S subunit
VGTALINGPNEFGSRFPLKSKWTTASVREAQTSDLIFCVRGSTGRRVIADDVYGLGRGVCSIRGRSGSQPFVNELITHELPRLLERTTGSVFSSLSAPDLREFSIPCPPQRIVDHFVSIVGIWHKKQDRLEFESGTLASIRNVLLPKLLSGALPVDQMDSVEGM